MPPKSAVTPKFNALIKQFKELREKSMGDARTNLRDLTKVQGTTTKIYDVQAKADKAHTKALKEQLKLQEKMFKLQRQMISDGGGGLALCLVGGCLLP